MLKACTNGEWSLDDGAQDSSLSGTYAVIIGVSHYPYIVKDGPNRPKKTYGLGQLSVSALTAYRFFEWLRDRYHFKWPREGDDRSYEVSPLRRCWLLLSPTSDEIAIEPALEVNQHEPTIGNCQAAIREWYSLMSNLKGPAAEKSRAFFFFSGHGLELDLDQQILLPCDYLRPNGMLNDAIGTYNLHGALAKLKVPHQFFFLDACRNDNKDLREEADLTGQTILDVQRSASANRSRIAPLFYASSSGSQTWQPPTPDQGLTFFGDALITGLQSTTGPLLDCSTDPCTIRLSPLLDFVDDRVNALLRKHNSLVKANINAGGVYRNVPITQIDINDDTLEVLVSPQPDSGVLGLPQEPAPALIDFEQNWTFDSPSPVSAHDLFGSEQVEAIWRNVQLYNFDREAWLDDPWKALRITRAQRDAAALSFRFDLQINDHGDRYWLALEDAAARFACVLPLHTSETIYSVVIEMEADTNGTRHIARMEAAISPESPGILGRAGRVWELYRARNAIAAADKIDADFMHSALRGSRPSALAGVIGTLILLRAQRDDMIATWLDDFASSFPNLPDGPVLKAEYRLRGGGKELSHDGAVSLLSDALRLGIPWSFEAIGYAARQADAIRDEERSRGKAAQENPQLNQELERLANARRHLRSGGLFCVFDDRNKRIDPELIRAPAPTNKGGAQMPTPTPTSPVAPDGALYTLLERCDEFRSNRRLRSVFEEPELADFSDRMEEADTIRDRIDLNVKYLRRQSTADGESALRVFLGVLARQYRPNDMRHRDLLNAMAAIPTQRQPSEPPQPLRFKLRDTLNDRFDLGDLRALCFDLGGVDFDNAPEGGKNVKVLWLIEYLERRNRLNDLVNAVRRLRPDVSFDAPPQ